MDMSLSEQLTYSTVLISCNYADGTSGCGTGFIIDLCYYKDTSMHIPVIITNNHVIENSVETSFEFCLKDDEGNPLDNQTFRVIYNGNAWIHHPDNDVDLTCLPFAQVLNETQQRNIKVFYIPLRTDLIAKQEQINQLSAMEEVIMLGYPIGLMDQFNHKPIIRKGITATHIKKDYQGKKEFLVDMACFPGSSGSPIFILNEGAYMQNNSLYAGSRLMLVGILYGGPQYSAQGELMLMDLPNTHQIVSKTQIPTNLGIAIKAERILDFETLFNK